MIEFATSIYGVALLFFLVALLYSSVGLGGGSSYTALMAIMGYSTVAIPMITLILNLCVTSIGSYNFIRKGHAQPRLIVPFLISSIPMAYLGGALQLPRETFYWVLLGCLVCVAARIYFWNSVALDLRLGRVSKVIISLATGSLLGLIAGIVGIGGGFLLVPLIIMLGLGTEKQAAASGAVFIWLNSLAGLVSRLQYNAIDLRDYVPLIVAVIIGGALGSFLGSSRLSRNVMDRILGAIVILAIAFLIRKLLAT